MVHCSGGLRKEAKKKKAGQRNRGVVIGEKAEKGGGVLREVNDGDIIMWGRQGGILNEEKKEELGELKEKRGHYQITKRVN